MRDRARDYKLIALTNARSIAPDAPPQVYDIHDLYADDYSDTVLPRLLKVIGIHNNSTIHVLSFRSCASGGIDRQLNMTFTTDFNPYVSGVVLARRRARVRVRERERKEKALCWFIVRGLRTP